MSYIQNFFTSRDNNADSATYVGQTGRIWWDPVTNAFYYSDGSTAGGLLITGGSTGNGVPGGTANSVQYNAGSGNFGGESYFTVDASNVAVRIGDLVLTAGNITGVVANANVAFGVLEPGTGVVDLLGPLNVHADSNIGNVATFSVDANGQVAMLVPTPDTNIGAVEIVGSASGISLSPGNPGGMLHVTGQNNQPSRIYNDGINNYPLYVGRRYNGLASAPTPVLANDVVSRLGANPYMSNGEFTPLGFAKIDFVATESPTPTAQGSKVQIYTTPDGANTQVITATFQPEGIDLGGNLIPTVNNTYQLGNNTNKWDSLYIGPSSLYIEDSVLGTDAEITVSNGALLINGTQKIQIGNMQMTTTGISLVNPASAANLLVGADTNTGYMEVNMVGIKFKDDTLQTTAAIPLVQKGNALGVVPLNASTKIDPVYLPAGGINFLGIWNAANNTPTLADGIGNVGDEYIVGVGGTQNLGAGNVTYAVGDFVLYTAGNVWEDIPTGGTGVSSFNTRTGVVTLNSGDVTNALSAGSIVNSKLATPSWELQVGQGIGLTGNATVELGDSITLTNTGVTAALAGTGVAVSAATGNVTFSIGQSVATNASVQFSTVSATLTVAATGNITGGNLNTGGRVTATGNISTSGYLLTPNTSINNGVVTTGNVQGSYILGNGSQLTGINAFGNIYANGTAVLATTGSSALTVTPGSNQVITGNNTSKTLTIAVNSNPTFGNVTITGNLIAANTSYISNVGNILMANTAPLPTAAPGILEYDGRVLYFTPQDQERGVTPSQEWYVLNADRGLTYASTTPQSLLGVGVHVSNATRYWFRLKATISRAAGSNNTALTLGWRGTATMTKLNYTAQASIGAVSTPTSSTTYETTLVSGFTAQNTVTGTNNPPDSTTLVIQGIIEVGDSGAGYVEPFISWTGVTAPGSVTVSALSYLQLFPVGVTGANTNVGNWA